MVLKEEVYLFQYQSLLTVIEAFDVKDEEYLQLRRDLITCDLVVWDDIGAVKLTEYQYSMLFNYIDARICAGKTNIFTSNANKPLLLENVGGRLFSRIWNLSEIIEFVGGGQKGRCDMVELQIISKILNEKSTAIYKTSGITLDYFLLYKEQMSFILTHEELYGSVPDKETFCSKFLDFNVIAVAESDKYLIEAFSEEYIHAQTVPILMKAAELMSTDANEAVNYLRAGIENLPKLSSSIGTDIITTANERFEQWQIKKIKPNRVLYTLRLS